MTTPAPADPHPDGRRPPDADASSDHGQPAPALAAGRRGARLGAAAAGVATWSLRFLLVSAALVVLAWVVGRLWVIVLPVLLGLLLATILWPPTSVLRRALAPALAAFLVLFSALALLGGVVWVLAPQVAEQAQQQIDAITVGLQNVRTIVTGPPLNLGEDQVDLAIERTTGWLRDNADSIAGGVLSGVTTAGSILVGALLAVVLCFFFLKDGPRFLPWISTLVGRHAAPHVAEIANRSWTTLSGFIKAQAAVGVVDAVAIGIGLVVLGVPLALPLSVLIFFGAFVPFVGATVTGVLAALVALVNNGLTDALIVAALILIVQQLEGNVLQPILVGQTLDLHPVLVILAVTAGGSLFGIVGAFLAVPVVAVATTILRYGRERLDDPEAPAPAEPATAPIAAGDGDTA